MSDEDALREIAGILEKPKTRRQMIGELLREASVLIVVFAPLETLFNPGVSSWWETAAIATLGLAVGYIGMHLEVRQP
jgi:hypothetical protein